MKSTAPLEVVHNFSIDEKTMIIHPNDGYDLEILQFSMDVLAFFNATIVEFNTGSGESLALTLVLSNDCKTGTIEMSKKNWQRTQKAPKVTLHLEGNKLLVAK